MAFNRKMTLKFDQIDGKESNFMDSEKC